MNTTFIKIFSLISIVALISSCAPSSKLVYLQNETESTNTNTYEPILQPDDALLIIISSENPEVAAPYNLKSVSLQSNKEGAVANEKQLAHIIDKEGNIEFPFVGQIKLAGATKSEAISIIKNALKEYIADASVYIKILNFKVSVLGEVNKPGTFTINSDRVTLLEALSLAGDLTVYGKRKNILIIREQDGNKKMERIDITNSNFLNSPYYYLAQNDVLYIEPNKTKVNASVVGPNLTVAISVISLLVTVLAITIR